jgi:hypothetical protein
VDVRVAAERGRLVAVDRRVESADETPTASAIASTNISDFAVCVVSVMTCSSLAVTSSPSNDALASPLSVTLENMMLTAIPPRPSSPGAT